MWQKFAINLLNNQKKYLFGIFCLLLFFCISIYKNGIAFSNTAAQLLPSSDPAMINAEKFKAKFGKEDNAIFIGFYEKEFKTEKQFKNLQKLISEIQHFEGVKNIVTASEALVLVKDTINEKFQTKTLFEKPTNLIEFKNQHKELRNFPFYENLLFNAKTNAWQMIVYFKPGILDTKLREQITLKINQKIEEFEVENNLELYASGMPLIRTMNKQVVVGESKQFVFAAFFATILMFFFFIRSFKATLGVFLLVLITILCSFGTISALGYKISILTGLVPPIIIIICVTNCVFIINKFFQEYKNKKKSKSLIEAISKIGRATFITNLTTAFGFFTFIFTESSTLQEFGIIATINIILVFALCIIFIPIYLANNSFEVKRENNESEWSKNTNKKLLYLIENHRTKIYVFSIILFLVSIFGISLFKRSSNILDEMSKNANYYREISFFDENFGGILPLEIVVSGNPKSAVTQNSIEKIDELSVFVDSIGNSSKLISFVEMVKFSKQAYYNNDASYFAIPSKSEKTFIAKYIKNSKGNKDQLKSYVDENQSTARLTTLLKNSDSDKLEQTVNGIELKIKQLFPEKETFVTGSAYLFMKGTTFLTKDLIKSIILALLVISLLMSTMFRSVPIVLISLIPNILSMIIVAGVMGYLGIPIKPSTILVFSISFGIAADDTIQFLNKYKQDLKTHKMNVKKAVSSSFSEMAQSMYSSSIILFVGFCTFLFSGFAGIQALGGLVALILLFAMFANVLILPALLLTLDKYSTKEFVESEEL